MVQSQSSLGGDLSKPLLEDDGGDDGAQRGLHPNLAPEDSTKSGWPALKSELKAQLRLSPPLSAASLGNCAPPLPPP